MDVRNNKRYSGQGDSCPGSRFPVHVSFADFTIVGKTVFVKLLGLEQVAYRNVVITCCNRKGANTCIEARWK